MVWAPHTSSNPLSPEQREWQHQLCADLKNDLRKGAVKKGSVRTSRGNHSQHMQAGALMLPEPDRTEHHPCLSQGPSHMHVLLYVVCEMGYATPLSSSALI